MIEKFVHTALLYSALLFTGFLVVMGVGNATMATLAKFNLLDRLL